MLLKNKLLSETPLTSTRNKYLDSSLTSVQCHLDLTYAIGASRSTPKHFLEASSPFACTESKYLLADGKSGKARHTSVNAKAGLKHSLQDASKSLKKRKKTRCLDDFDVLDDNQLPPPQCSEDKTEETMLSEERRSGGLGLGGSGFQFKGVEFGQLNVDLDSSNVLSSNVKFHNLNVASDSSNTFGSNVKFRQINVASDAFGSSCSFSMPNFTFGSPCMPRSAPPEPVAAIITQMPSYTFTAAHVDWETDSDIFTLKDAAEASKGQSIINLKSTKLQFINVVNMALLHSLNLKKSEDSYRVMLVNLADGIRVIDPEFILKVALYARQVLQIRVVSNFLLSYASLYPETRVYLEKYFRASIVLPSDWLQVAEYYQVLKGVNSYSLPAALRSSMKKTFEKFDEYQLAKYNRVQKKSTSKQPGLNSTNDATESNLSCPKIFTLKNLIHTLHISTPAETVMCLLEKKYPSSYSEFQKSGLPGKWDASRAGIRMKLPVPKTWETQISCYGNDPKIWENLIDENKLPYMAMLRNLKNLLLAGISAKHHTKVLNMMENKKSVMHSRQLPMQFYEAYKTLSLLQSMLGNEDEDSTAFLKEQVPRWKIARIRKEKMKIKNISHSVIERYKVAVSNALETSSLHNLSPIPGKTLIICIISPLHAKWGKSKLLENCLLMGLMCMKACEDCKMTVVSNSGFVNTVTLKDDCCFLDNMTTVSKLYEKMFKENDDEPTILDHSSIRHILEFYLKPQTMFANKLDHVVTLWASLASSYDVFELYDSVMSTFLVKYRKIVNPDLLYTAVDFDLKGKRFSDLSLIKLDSEKDLHLCGSSSSLIKFIANRSSGGQLTDVENIDLKFNLSDTTSLKKIAHKGKIDSQKENVMPCILKEPKWHTVKVFISSTFKDMLSERDLLIRYVFPELKRRAASVFVKLAEIDLRWGITESDSQTKRAAELCLLEAQKSDFFLGFVGERYGTIYDFESPDLPDLDWVREYESGLSITELEMHAGALRDSENRRKRAFFYFRDNSFLRYVPKKWVHHFTSEDSSSKSKINELKKKIKDADFKVFDNYPCHFSGIFESKPILAGLNALGDRVLEDLWQSIKELNREKSFNVLENEENFQSSFIDSLSFYVKGKDSPIENILVNLKSVDGLFVIAGASGLGKTALCIELLKKMTGYIIAKHFVGFSARSQDVSFMIQNICYSICKELSLLIELPHSAEDIVSQFPDFLIEIANCCGGRDIILLIDGLDHLDVVDQRLDWLPLFLPARVKFICTASETSEAFKILNERQRHGHNIYIQYLSPLQQSERENFVRNYLKYYKKVLDDNAFNNQMLKIITKNESYSPLYLRIVCDFLRLYGSFGNLTTILQKLPSTMKLLFQEIILKLENEFGTMLVQSTLTLLCISKLGLEDNDLHYILSFVMTEKYQRLTSYDALKENILNLEPENLLSQVKYCSLMQVILIFAFGQLRQSLFSLIGTNFELAVKSFYLNKNYDSVCLHLHSVLAAYFHNWCDPHNNGKYSGNSGFAVRSLLHHMCEGHLYRELGALLCNHSFIEAAFEAKAEKVLFDCYSLLLFNVLEKNQKLNREIIYSDLHAFYDFVSRNFHILHKHPKLITQQAINEPPQSVVSLCKENFKACLIENLAKNEVLNCRLATITGFVKNITASNAGKQTSLVYLGSENGYLKVLDLLTRKVVFSVKGHFASITSICYATKNRICTSSVDGSLSLWDSNDFCRIAVLKGHFHRVSSCCADPAGCILFSSGWDNSVRLWSLVDGRSVSIIDYFKCPVNCLGHHPLKQQIACGLWDGNIHIVDTISMKKINVFQSISGSVKSLCYSPDGVSLISCFMDSEICILSAEEGLKISSLKGHYLPVKSFTFASDFDAFISGSEDCTLKVWSSSSNNDYSVIDDFKSCSISLIEFLSENFLAVAFHNSELQVLDINNGKAVAKFNLAPDSVSCLSNYSESDFEGLSKFVDSLVIGTLSGKLIIGNLNSLDLSLKYDMKSKITAISYGFNILLCGSADGDIGLFSFNGNLEFNVVKRAHKASVTSICLTGRNDALFALSFSSDNVLKLWRFSKTSLEISLEKDYYNKHKDAITCAVFCPMPIANISDNAVPPSCSFFTGSHDNSIILWNDEPARVFKGLHSSIRSIACSANYLIGCSSDGAVIIWSMNGNVLSSFSGIESSFSAPAFFIAKGESGLFDVLLAYIERDGSIRIKKPLQRSYSHSLEGHLKPITSCCATENGEIISCSLDGSVNVWKLPSSLNQKHSYHHSSITGVLFSPSCEYVLSSDADGYIILWKTDFLSGTSPLLYCASENFPNGFIRKLSWIQNDSFICAVNEKCDEHEKHFLATISLESNNVSEGPKISLQVKTLQYFKNEISCLDSCAKTGSVALGTKSGKLTLISSGKQKTHTVSNDWVLGVGFLSVHENSDHCAVFMHEYIVLYPVADFINARSMPNTSARLDLRSPEEPLLVSSVSCNKDSSIFSGGYEGKLIYYAQGTKKCIVKAHQGSISGICSSEEYLFTCSLDRTVKVWTVPSFKQVGQFYSQVPITCLAVERNSAANSGHNVLVFGTSSGELKLLKFFV